MAVIVVGAGLSGLAAARTLSKAGAEVVVLEGRDRVGGRTEGMLLDDRTPLELGGQWLGEGHTRMAELVAELGLATFRTYNDEGELLLDLGGKRSRMASHKGAMPKLSPFVLADLAQGLARFERLAKRVTISSDRGGPRVLSGWTGRPGRPGSGVTCAPAPAGSTSTPCLRGGLGRPARGPVAAPRAVLHPLQRRPRDADLGRSRRPAGPGGRRFGAGRRCDGRGAG